MGIPFFELQATSGKARAAVIHTAHGDIATPIFMPVGTRGAVKTLQMEELEAFDYPIILGNTYHLYLRPGHALIDRMGGLHKFISWPHAILTDSGGFQVYSLAKLRKISAAGVEFRSHIDGSLHFLGPQESMAIQKALGSDIVMAFDECPALPATSEQLRQAIERTIAWAKKCREFPLQEHQHLFGIVQGGLDLALRQECLARLQEIGFAGYALGGLSVGETPAEMKALLDAFADQLPADAPRYLMGVGTPSDLVEAVHAGIDMFDCVLPTRNARNGQALTRKGPLNIRLAKYKEDARPLDERCACSVCRRYSRAYLRHLHLVGEQLAGQLLSLHNLYYYRQLVRQMREAIAQQRFDDFYQNFYKDYAIDGVQDGP